MLQLIKKYQKKDIFITRKRWKIIYELGQSSKFKTKNWVEVNYNSRRTYNTNGQIKFKISISKSSLCNFSDACMLVKGIISVPNTVCKNNANREIMLKNCAPFTDCISGINNTQVDNANDIGVVMPMNNLIEYSYNYSNTSGTLR